MNCNIELHESLIESGDIVCPFCDFQLTYVKQKPQDRLAKYDLCCECRSCGIVQGYDSSTEYIDFYESKHKMKRKSVYHRKYHINNVLLEISSSHNITFSVEQKNKILRIFAEIDKILPQINGERKRIISVNFILKKIFKLLSIKFNNLPITKSKKTLASYEKYWKQIYTIIDHKIKEIIK